MRPDEVVHSEPEILGGTPVFVGTRVPVRTLIDHLEAGDTIEQFLHSFPPVSREQAVAAREMFEAGTLKDTAISVILVTPLVCLLLFHGWKAYRYENLIYLDLSFWFDLIFWIVATTALVIKRLGPNGRAKRKEARLLEALRKIGAEQQPAKPEEDPVRIENDRLSRELAEAKWDREKKRQEAREKHLMEQCELIIGELSDSHAYSGGSLEIKKEFANGKVRFAVTHMIQGNQPQNTDPVFECFETTGGGDYYEEIVSTPDGEGGFIHKTSTKRSAYYSHVEITAYKAGEWENQFGALAKLALSHKEESRRKSEEQHNERMRKELEEKKARFGL